MYTETSHPEHFACAIWWWIVSVISTLAEVFWCRTVLSPKYRKFETDFEKYCDLEIRVRTQGSLKVIKTTNWYNSVACYGFLLESHCNFVFKVHRNRRKLEFWTIILMKTASS